MNMIGRSGSENNPPIRNDAPAWMLPTWIMNPITTRPSRMVDSDNSVTPGKNGFARLPAARAGVLLSVIVRPSASGIPFATTLSQRE